MAGASGSAVKFSPAGGLCGTLEVPPDKSISHRAAIISAISNSPVQIHNFLQAADTSATLWALRACGVKVENRQGSDPVIHGAGLTGLAAPGAIIDIGNSGTSMRLLPGVFAGQQGRFTLDGDESIRRRPMDRIVAPLKGMGVDIDAREGRFAPVSVTGGEVHAIHYRMPVASAQVKSAILLAGLYADGPCRVTEPTVCRDHTEIILGNAGARVEKRGLETVIHPAEVLHLESLEVPGDFSSAAFLLVAATIITGSEIRLTGVGINPTRTGLLDIMIEMGADIRRHDERLAGGEQVADLEVSTAGLKGFEVDSEISGRAIDELPLVALLGAFATGDTTVSGAAELKFKESDRVAGLVSNLSAVGVDIEARQDGFVVHGGTGVNGGAFDSFGDHRMAMLGAVAGLASSEGVTVSGFGCVDVSFPGFDKVLAGLQGKGG